jgi:hypothetical protein
MHLNKKIQCKDIYFLLQSDLSDKSTVETCHAKCPAAAARKG